MNSSTDSLSSQVALIRGAFLRAAGSQLTGAQLRALIDATCPDFDLRAAVEVPVGPGALTKLLKTHFSDIVHPIGKHGGDNIYLIGSPVSDPRTDNVAPRQLGLWVAFANPNLGQEVIFDRIDKTLTVQSKSGNISEHQVRLAPISAEEFRAIADQFADSSPADIQPELRKVLTDGDLFYQVWISTLKKLDAALYHRWGLFRVQSVIGLFRERLVTAEVPAEDVEDAVQKITTDQASAYKERSQAIRSNIRPVGRSDIFRTVPEVGSPLSGRLDINDVRAIANLAINYMSLTEIRQVSIPLGAMIDAGLLSRK